LHRSREDSVSEPVVVTFECPRDERSDAVRETGDVVRTGYRMVVGPQEKPI